LNQSKISPLAGYALVLYLTESTEHSAVGQPENLDSLTCVGTHADVSPLKGLTEWKFLFLDNNSYGLEGAQ
jgi:hypothetical protein